MVADAAVAGGANVVGFIDDGAACGSRVAGLPVMTFAQVMGDPSFHPADLAVALALGDNRVRQRIASLVRAAGLSLFTVVHPAAVVARSARLGEAVAVLARAVINPDASVEEGAIINTGAIVEHDCHIGAFAHLSPNAALGGAVVIGTRTHVGLGAVVLPGLNIGSDVRVGAGAAVVRDVAENLTVVGVPARRLERALEKA